MITKSPITLKISLPAFILITACILTACNLPGSQTTLPTPSFPTAQPTSGPVIVLPTVVTPPPAITTPAADVPAVPVPTLALPPTNLPPTAIPPTAVPPTVAPIPSTTIPGAVRINFAPGATEGIIEGQIQPGQVLNYLVGAAQGQPMLVATDSINHDVTFALVGLGNGQALLDSIQKLNSWQTILPATQDYLIQVIGGTSLENFSLNVTTPARINFDPGAISAVRQGNTPGGFTVSYVLRANANQQMDINLTAPNGNAVLSIYGYQDGQPYLRSVVESTIFSLKLPASQDYIIQVVPMAGQVAPYIMNITVK